MIPRAEIHKSLWCHGLRDNTSGRCTDCCTAVPLDHDLALLVNTWRQLTAEQRFAVAQVASGFVTVRV